MKRLSAALATAALVSIVTTSGVTATHETTVITLPGATGAEGVVSGNGSTFYAGDLNLGDIYRGDMQTGTASLFIDAPDGRMAFGLRIDHDLLFVAGGFTGQGYVYDLTTGASVATYQFADPSAGAIINDVIVARGAAWFTDSSHPTLYRVPVGPDGELGPASALTVTGPAADLTGQFNMNGIAASPDGTTLIVAHTADATIYTVNPMTGASGAIAGANLPNVDGILFEAGHLWAVQNFSNQVTELKLSQDLSSATVEKVYTNDAFQTPTTIARHGDLLGVANSKFATPGASTFEVVTFDR